MKKKRPLVNKFYYKLALVLMLVLLVAGSAYVILTANLAKRYFLESTQQLNKDVASHLVEEKFGNQKPFLPDGSVNKALFGDIMHDMMAVNRGIEVFLLNPTGEVLYSVVLDHNNDKKKAKKVSLSPIRKFISDRNFVLGDDPRDSENQKIFSAAEFDVDGQQGYIYIILTGKEYDHIAYTLRNQYFSKLGIYGVIATILLALIIGLVALWYMIKNLRTIIETVTRFKEGDNDARITNMEGTEFDILATTFNDMADTIDENINELKSVEKLRRELIANVSHDLRTPLAIMKGYIETLLLKEDDFDKEQKRKHLSTIQNSTEKLSKLVTQLFEYSKLESNQIEPEKEPFLISDLALDIHSKYQILAEKKKINLELDMEEGTPLVFADLGLVERAIQNLIDNAIKFTPEGGNIVIKIIPSGTGVEFSIKDSGPGISPDQQSLIFERYRTDAKKNISSNNAGLGLAIAQKILEIHNATIHVTSELNKGAKFYFSLPVYAGA